jgi:hypothetical protein
MILKTLSMPDTKRKVVKNYSNHVPKVHYVKSLDNFLAEILKDESEEFIATVNEFRYRKDILGSPSTNQELRDALNSRYRELVAIISNLTVKKLLKLHYIRFNFLDPKLPQPEKDFSRPLALDALKHKFFTPIDGSIYPYALHLIIYTFDTFQQEIIEYGVSRRAYHFLIAVRQNDHYYSPDDVIITRQVEDNLRRLIDLYRNQS